MAKQYVVTEEEFMSLVESLELTALRKHNMLREDMTKPHRGRTFTVASTTLWFAGFNKWDSRLIEVRMKTFRYQDSAGWHHTVPEPTVLEPFTNAQALQWMACNREYTVDTLPDGRKLMRFRPIAFISKEAS